MGVHSLLSTIEAAVLSRVDAATVNRWATEGIWASIRMAGGRRRFERQWLEALLQPSLAADALSSRDQQWVEALVSGRRQVLEPLLLETVRQVECWWEVAEQLDGLLGTVSALETAGQLTPAEAALARQHMASLLCGVAQALPTPADGPWALLAGQPCEEHSLGLSLAELCARALGWNTLWLGRPAALTSIQPMLDAEAVGLVLVPETAAREMVDGLQAQGAAAVSVLQLPARARASEGQGRFQQLSSQLDQLLTAR